MQAPHRVASTFAVLAERGAGDRPVLFARELTKLHEELFRGTVATAAAWLAAKAPRGEFTVVLASGGGSGAGAEASAEAQADAAAAALAAAAAEVAALVSGGASVSAAVKQVAKASKGVAKNDLYKRALEASTAATPSASG